MTLLDLEGTLCDLHGAIIHSNGRAAYCTHEQGAPYCKTVDLLKLAESRNGTSQKSKAPIADATEASTMREAERRGDANQPYSNGHAGRQAEDWVTWRRRIEILALSIYRADDEYHKAHLTGELILPAIRQDLMVAAGGGLKQHPEYALPDGWSWGQAEQEIDGAALRAWEVFREKSRNDLIVASGVVVREEPGAIQPIVIPWESFDAAVEANAEYLKRDPVVDKLCYSHAVSMITGGKHAGKSTLARWLAVCVCKGWEFLRREVRQGPVMYIASEDETMAARQELLRLGWERTDPLFFLSATNAPNDDQARFMGQLTQDIIEKGVKLVVIDMLFDFVNIQDEIKYAETRRAVGVIQTLASLSGTHVVVIHHAPKYADSAAEAGVTALGSQGLAARVSPIILVRRHGPEVHSVSSTAVRDPRGQSLEESKLLKNADGSVTLGGSWKMWMQADVFAPRVRELLATEPGQEMTAGDVKDALGITYQLASGALSKLYKAGDIGRSGDGKKGKPFRYSTDGPKISSANGQIIHHGVDPLHKSEEPHPNAQGQFGYKEN